MKTSLFFLLFLLSAITSHAQWDSYVSVGVTGSFMFNKPLNAVIDSFNTQPGVMEEMDNIKGLKGIGIRYGAWPYEVYDVGINYQTARTSGSRKNDILETEEYEVVYHFLNFNYSYGFPIVEEEDYQVIPGGALNLAYDATTVTTMVDGYEYVSGLTTYNFDIGLEGYVQFMKEFGWFTLIGRPYVGIYGGLFDYSDLFYTITTLPVEPQHGVAVVPKFGVDLCIGASF